MDALIDPVTNDYAAGSAGQAGDLRRDPVPGIGNAVLLRLMTPLGSWWAEPALGSRLHELQRQKDTARVEALAKQYARAALQPLLDDGRCTAIEVETERVKDNSQGGRLQLLVLVTPAGAEPQTFRFPVRVA